MIALSLAVCVSSRRSGRCCVRLCSSTDHRPSSACGAHRSLSGDHHAGPEKADPNCSRTRNTERKEAGVSAAAQHDSQLDWSCCAVRCAVRSPPQWSKRMRVGARWGAVDRCAGLCPCPAVWCCCCGGVCALCDGFSVSPETSETRESARTHKKRKGSQAQDTVSGDHTDISIWLESRRRQCAGWLASDVRVDRKKRVRYRVRGPPRAGSFTCDDVFDSLQPTLKRKRGMTTRGPTTVPLRRRPARALMT